MRHQRKKEEGKMGVMGEISGSLDREKASNVRRKGSRQHSERMRK